MVKKYNYKKDVWFMKFRKDTDNEDFNLKGILKKMKFLNELRIWYGESCFVDSEVIIHRAIITVGGWIKVYSEKVEDAKDLKGKKYKIKIIETKIRRTDSNWLKNGE